jgi:hypothetical protein
LMGAAFGWSKISREDILKVQVHASSCVTETTSSMFMLLLVSPVSTTHTRVVKKI